MKTTTKRKISGLLALMTALSVLAAGCEKTNEDVSGIPEMTSVSESATEQSLETEAPSETTSETTETTSETSETEETTTVTSEETTAETEETSETSAGPEWSETAMSATMYVTEKCYAREKALIGATTISQYYEGDTVEIIALTDTGYYKLAEGGFIHSDYLSDTKPVVTTASPETSPAETSADNSDPDDSSDNGSDNGSGSGSGNSGSSGGTVSGTGNYNVKFTSRYAYKQLNSTEQTFYKNVVEAAMKLDRVVEVPEGLTKDDVIKVYSIVYNSEPQLFWMGGTINAGSVTATISFKTNDASEIASMQAEIDSAASSILSKVNQYSGTVSKLKVIFDSVVLKNDFSKSVEGYNCSIYNGLTGKGNLQCAGYAKTTQYLCDLAGIECCVITGTDANGNSHAWNVVYCENGYYNLDTTWGDPINSFGSDYIQYEFFLVPDAWIHNITHYNVNKLFRSNGSEIKLFNPPSCTKESCNYFAAYNKLYSSKSDAENAMYKAIDDAIAAGKNVAEIRVTDKSIYDELMSNDYFRKFQNYAKDKSSSVKQLSRMSSFTAGVYVVHYDIIYN